MYFSVFCGHKESNGLFHELFNRAWICGPIFDGVTFDDDFSMFIMGGEL
jgi:hypothetical protein